MRIDPHLQVEVVESTGEVITVHVTLARPETFVMPRWAEPRGIQ